MQPRDLVTSRKSLHREQEDSTWGFYIWGEVEIIDVEQRTLGVLRGEGDNLVVLKNKEKSSERTAQCWGGR